MLHVIDHYRDVFNTPFNFVLAQVTLPTCRKRAKNAASALAEAADGRAARGAVGSRDSLAHGQAGPCPCQARQERAVAEQGRQDVGGRGRGRGAAKRLGLNLPSKAEGPSWPGCLFDAGSSDSGRFSTSCQKHSSPSQPVTGGLQQPRSLRFNGDFRLPSLLGNNARKLHGVRWAWAARHAVPSPQGLKLCPRALANSRYFNDWEQRTARRPGGRAAAKPKVPRAPLKSRSRFANRRLHFKANLYLPDLYFKTID